MIDREHELSVTRQALVLDISRSSVYYLPCPTSPDDLALMRRIDELHLDYPFAGARADEADGHRGDLPPTQYQQACARP